MRGCAWQGLLVQEDRRTMLLLLLLLRMGRRRRQQRGAERIPPPPFGPSTSAGHRRAPKRFVYLSFTPFSPVAPSTPRSPHSCHPYSRPVPPSAVARAGDDKMLFLFDFYRTGMCCWLAGCPASSLTIVAGLTCAAFSSWSCTQPLFSHGGSAGVAATLHHGRKGQVLQTWCLQGAFAGGAGRSAAPDFAAWARPAQQC